MMVIFDDKIQERFLGMIVFVNLKLVQKRGHFS
jgi:hypothetical protein